MMKRVTKLSGISIPGSKSRSQITYRYPLDAARILLDAVCEVVRREDVVLVRRDEKVKQSQENAFANRVFLLKTNGKVKYSINREKEGRGYDIVISRSKRYTRGQVVGITSSPLFLTPTLFISTSLTILFSLLFAASTALTIFFSVSVTSNLGFPKIPEKLMV